MPELFEQLLKPNELRFVIDIAFGIVAGILIGIEREARGKDAGISTNTFVILGAMLFTFLSSHVDPASESRIAAQVVSGIGFLGAGLILKEGTTVKNLTTAASVWYAGAIGMAIGFEYYFVALLAVVAAILIPRIPHVNPRDPIVVEAKEESGKKTGSD